MGTSGVTYVRVHLLRGGVPPLVAHPLRPGNVIFGVGESGTVVPLRTGAASAPGRPSHAGAGDAPHEVFLASGRGGGAPDPWGLRA